jgi:hypothetical protein
LCDSEFTHHTLILLSVQVTVKDGHEFQRYAAP